MKTLRQVYFVAWALLLSLFAVLAAPKLWQNLRSGHVVPPSPTASIDSLLGSVLEIREPSTQLLRSAARIPPSQRTVFVSTKDEARCDFVYSAICYLTWPRKIDKVELAPNEAVPQSAAAVFICGIGAAAPQTQSIGPHLTLRIPANSP